MGMDSHVDIHQLVASRGRSRLFYILQSDALGSQSYSRFPIRMYRWIRPLRQIVLEGVSWTF